MKDSCVIKVDAIQEIDITQKPNKWKGMVAIGLGILIGICLGLILYEFDSSPFCRKVRDACTVLDLEVDVRPCPGALEGGHFSDEHLKLHGKRTVPYLTDEGASLCLCLFLRRRVL